MERLLPVSSRLGLAVAARDGRALARSLLGGPKWMKSKLLSEKGSFIPTLYVNGLFILDYVLACSEEPHDQLKL